MTATIAERVAAGAKFLDEHDPDWWKADVERAIDLDTLELADSRMCVLGQRCPLETLASYNRAQIADLSEDADIERYYAFGLALMRTTGDRRPLFYWAAGHGFTSEAGGWAGLTAEWKRLIEARRSA
jgi:hypothetical protein